MKKGVSNKLKYISKNSNSDMQIAISALLKVDDDLQLGGDVETTEWIDTGIKSLNFALSGDMDKGIPAGKMIVFAGESQTGKSFIGGRISANAQKAGFVPVWVDTEYAVDKRFFVRIGLDPSNMIYRRLNSAEQLQVTVLKLLKTAKEKGIKLFIVLDSLGNLMGSKELADADADKQTQDMGNRAKSLRTALRNILTWIDRTNSILYCVNHIYIKPGFIPETKMGGGLAASYLAQIVVFLTKKKAEPGISVKLKCKVMKNREFIEGRICEFVLNFKDGIDETDGIMDLFKEFDIIEEKRGWVTIDGKSLRPAKVVEDKELMDKLISNLKDKTKDKNYHSFTDNNEYRD